MDGVDPGTTSIIKSKMGRQVLTGEKITFLMDKMFPSNDSVVHVLYVPRQRVSLEKSSVGDTITKHPCRVSPIVNPPIVNPQRLR